MNFSNLNTLKKLEALLELQQQQHQQEQHQQQEQEQEQKFFKKVDPLELFTQISEEKYGFKSYNLLPNTFIYRVTKQENLQSDKATYFSLWYGTTNKYIKKNRDNYLQVYSVKKNKTLNILDLSNLDVINTLLRLSFYYYL